MAAMIIIGVIALLGGGALLWGRMAALNKAQQLKTATHRTVAELQEMSKEVGSELGRGSYNELVELRGTIECSSPLESELSKQECVYYRMRVDREYEEEYEEYDEQRKQHVRRTRRGTTSLSSNTRSCPFLLRDETGAVMVRPDGADIDAERVLSSYEPESRMMGMGGGMLSYGGFSFSLGGRGFGGSRTLGYKLEEYALPIGRDVYVLGEVSDAEGKLTVQKPSKRANKFVISPKSKEALVQATQKSALFFLIGAIVCFVAGVGLVIGGLVS